MIAIYIGKLIKEFTFLTLEVFTTTKYLLCSKKKQVQVRVDNPFLKKKTFIDSASCLHYVSSEEIYWKINVMQFV